MPQCNQCRYVYDCMDKLFTKIGGDALRVAYDEKFKDNPCNRRKFIEGCHMLRQPDLDTWILLVLSEKKKHSDSLKRKINSLDYVPEVGLCQRLIDGEPLFKMTKTQAAEPFARRQEDPPLIY